MALLTAIFVLSRSVSVLRSFLFTRSSSASVSFSLDAKDRVLSILFLEDEFAGIQPHSSCDYSRVQTKQFFPQIDKYCQNVILFVLDFDQS